MPLLLVSVLNSYWKAVLKSMLIWSTIVYG
jgi:hypothetical protein